MKTLLLASGGIDSTTLLYELASRGEIAEVMSFNYGQASAPTQKEYLRYHASKLSVPLLMQGITWPDYMKGKGFIFQSGHYPEPHADAYEASRMNREEYVAYCRDKWDFMHARNSIFLSYAVGRAAHLGVERIVTAYQFDREEWEAMDASGTYGGNDVTPWFVDAFNTLMAVGGTYLPIRVETPYLTERLTKRQIVRRGRKLGVDYEKTYSCEFYPPCGACHQCLVKADVLASTHQSRVRLSR